MSEAQFGLILAAIASLGGALIGALRWAVGRVTASNDAGTKALIDNTASNAVLKVKIDELVSSAQRLADRIDGIGDFVDEFTPVNQPRPRTPPRGVPVSPGMRIPRPGTNHDR